MRPAVVTVLSWMVSLITPLTIMGLGVRLVLLPAFPMVEYRRPGFPPDAFGFGVEERLHWAGYAWAYLVNEADISYLGDLRLENGASLFNDRELSHMADVKRVLAGSMRVWQISLIALGLLGLAAWRFGWSGAFITGLARGGWIMVGIAAAVAFVALVGITLLPDLFWGFFSAFHTLFFEGDTWLFATSDSLIRLFPIRYWQDAFLLAAAVALGGGFALGLGLKPR